MLCVSVFLVPACTFFRFPETLLVPLSTLSSKHLRFVFCIVCVVFNFSLLFYLCLGGLGLDAAISHQWNSACMLIQTLSVDTYLCFIVHYPFRFAFVFLKRNCHCLLILYAYEILDLIDPFVSNIKCIPSNDITAKNSDWFVFRYMIGFKLIKIWNWKKKTNLIKHYMLRNIHMWLIDFWFSEMLCAKCFNLQNSVPLVCQICYLRQWKRCYMWCSNPLLCS